jgi:hypothetical protein
VTAFNHFAEDIQSNDLVKCSPVKTPILIPYASKLPFEMPTPKTGAVLACPKGALAFQVLA